MELTPQDLELIEGYLNGTLGDAERQAFEARMASEAELVEAVDMQRDIEAAVQASGRSAMKEHLAGIGASVLAAGELDGYQPSARDTGAPGKATFNTIIALVVAFGGILGYQYIQQRSIQEATKATDSTATDSSVEKTVKRDTIWKEQPVQKPRVEYEKRTFMVKDGDTIEVDPSNVPSGKVIQIDTLAPGAEGPQSSLDPTSKPRETLKMAAKGELNSGPVLDHSPTIDREVNPSVEENRGESNNVEAAVPELQAR